MKAIINGKILTENNVIEDKILLFDDKIIDFCDEVEENVEIIDAKGLYVSCKKGPPERRSFFAVSVYLAALAASRPARKALRLHRYLIATETLFTRKQAISHIS